MFSMFFFTFSKFLASTTSALVIYSSCFALNSHKLRFFFSESTFELERSLILGSELASDLGLDTLFSPFYEAFYFFLIFLLAYSKNFIPYLYKSFCGSY
jgi:hypothetical protein